MDMQEVTGPWKTDLKLVVSTHKIGEEFGFESLLGNLWKRPNWNKNEHSV